MIDQQVIVVWLDHGRADVQRADLMAGAQIGSRSAGVTVVQWAGLEETPVLWAGMEGTAVL